MAMVEEGKPAPEFTLPSSSGGEVSLAALRGRPVVLYFYPRDNTPGCTREACAFRDAMSQMKRRGAVVLGVSPEIARGSRQVQDAAQAELPAALGPGQVMYGKKVKGIVRKTFPKVKVDGHAEEVLEALKALS